MPDQQLYYGNGATHREAQANLLEVIPDDMIPVSGKSWAQAADGVITVMVLTEPRPKPEPEGDDGD